MRVNYDKIKIFRCTVPLKIWLHLCNMFDLYVNVYLILFCSKLFWTSVVPDLFMSSELVYMEENTVFVI